VLTYHKNSLSQALIELFPDIRFNKENLCGNSKFYHLLLFLLSINSHKYKDGKINE
jgi:hypothetical protein